ncbi:ATP-binding protein [Actinomadura craniellae]|uniref:histidine kinase n=1 Tax=Actinomadura craniellae TaxID=2231787 RepID=A0A365H9F6_9ACTN|nr:ATP-binding protein [Actinomadura craniellae]RAY15717.1 ATP-binding protein [Actinomadura craniellae]
MAPFLWAAVFAYAAAGVLLLRERRIRTALTRQNASLTTELRARDGELRHLVSTRLPELADSLRNPAVTVSGPLYERELAGTEYARGLQSVMDMFTESAGRAGERADQSAKTTLRAMMRVVQSLANEQQVAISDMQERHDDPAVLADLLRIDHMNAQLGRRVQATAVLCGSWPGQQRSASALTDVVRGATSRIRDYLRVRLYAQMNMAVVSRAVEPVVLTLAELLDNAARHSQPNTSVEVNFQATHNGVAMMIDDAGVAMGAEELHQAARRLSGQQALDIHRLGDPPQVGFAVAGVLAARYGFTVSVDTQSPYGGVRAVVFLPMDLLTRIPAETGAPGAAPEQPAAREDRAGQTSSGLPKRRRMEVAAAVAPSPEPADRPARPAREIAAGMGAWQRGTRSGRAAPLDSEGKEPRA